MHTINITLLLLHY